MGLEEIRVESYTLIPIDPETLTQIQNAIQLAKQKTLPGQVMIIPIGQGVAFSYAPQEKAVVAKRVSAPAERFSPLPEAAGVAKL